MFNRELFEYDPQTHVGRYDGKVVPSVTQLVDMLYPMNDDIPQERIKIAAERGTKIHGAIEDINKGFDTCGDYEKLLKQAIDKSIESDVVELKDYVSVLSAYKLKPYDYEELIFLLDENQDLICFGHYDFTALSMNDNILFQEGRLYLFDAKTTSQFYKEKVAFQMSIYATAYEQCSKNFLSGIYGLWLRDGVSLIPLERKDNRFVINVCKGLAKNYEIH